MRKSMMFLIIFIILTTSSCSQKKSDGLVLVKGGTFISTKSNLYNKGVIIPDFYISKYEVTQKEWQKVMDYNPSVFKGDDLPVEMVNWYECIEYCNKLSSNEGLEPYYNIDKANKDPNNLNEMDDIKWTVTINKEANGYRLPTEAEWEYAASGGQKSNSFSFSGSDSPDEVAWYYKNSGDEYLDGEWLWPNIESNNNKTQKVGMLAPNELGLYDMSGNVREWCWDWYGEILDIDKGYVRSWRGGGWLGDSTACEISYRGNYEANSMGYDQGFRICRNR